MKAEFRSELTATLITDRTWRLHEPLVFYSDILKQEVIVPKDFFTDFASVRRVPFIFDFLGDEAHEAAVIHDYLYKKNSIPVVEREIADDIFDEAMIASDIWKWRRMIFYYGVRIGGELFYHKHSL